MLDFEFLKQTFSDLTFFKDKTWKLSPSPLDLSAETVLEIEKIGEACFDFLAGINQLYFFSKTNKSILRNKNFCVPWVADYFDRGKPQYLLEHANLPLFKNTLPNIIRLDLLLTDQGLAMTEIEVIPGGIGFTSFLHQLYETQTPLVGSSQKMLSGFYESMANLMPQKDNPTIVIAVSHESETYRPEFEWLAKELQKLGKSVYCVNPEDFFFEDSKIKFNINNKKLDIDVIYRFFELFDLNSIPTSSILINAIQNNQIIVSPPLKPIFEEKLCLALFHHYQLQDYWKKTLKKESYEVLKKVIPLTWILDGEDFGPNAVLNGPTINGNFLHSWEQLGQASQKNRDFIIKISGFHEKAWGARSITLGSDTSQLVWASKIQEALENAQKHPYILQVFKKPKSITHPFYDDTGKIISKPSRIRLCPYFMKNQSDSSSDLDSTLKGILATLCPSDKKIIHGMSVATFIPCKSIQN